MGDPTRPALRWHGGKWMLAPWIIDHLPPHRVYVEPYGGAASVLLRKARSYAEVYNDLDAAVVNLFRVLQDRALGDRLIALLRLTPFARAEFELSYQATDDPVEAARRLIVRSFMGFGSDGHNTQVRTGFRADSNKSGTTPAHDWVNYPDCLGAVVARFVGVVVESRPALQVLRRHDKHDVLAYVDPPYLPATRSQKSRRSGVGYHAYTHEMSVDDHAEMLEALRGLEGMAVLSGYPSVMYDEALKGWRRIERPALADGARPRTEVLWLNPQAEAAMRRPRQADLPDLHQGAA